MSKRFALSTIATACALCLALVGCGGGSASSSTESKATSSETTSSTESSSTSDSASSSKDSSSSSASSSDKHYSYFVGKWDLYETEEYTHEQVEQVMKQYATDEEVRTKTNEAYGRDNVEFCARFNADGTGEVDTGKELVPFTWEATNEGAITFTSFNGKETALHLPVNDGKFTLNGDTYAKAN